METYDEPGCKKGIGAALKRAGVPGRAILIFLIAIIVVVGGSIGLLESNDAGYITVKQSIFTGKVSIIPEPGLFCQCFGKVTKYKEAGTFMFARREKTPDGKGSGKYKRGKGVGPEVAAEIEVRFNDGGIGWISGMALFDLPKETEKLALLHKKFRSFKQLLEAGIVSTIKESVVLTAALMSSGESYTTKRATFSEWARDQLANGTYVTEEIVKGEKDSRTGNIAEKSFVKIKMVNGSRLRNESPLARYGIELKQFQITDIRYESATEKLIMIKREALQKTIAAKIAAERSIQERLAAEEMGKKNVKIAEYVAMTKMKKAEVEAEEEKAVAVIMAQKKLEVAKIHKEQEMRGAKKRLELEKLAKSKALVEALKVLEVAKINAKSAERNKTANIFEGQGLAEKKRLIYKADGALQQKLDAYVKVMTVLAKELGKQKWVPDITMNGGEGGSSGSNAAMNFMNLWMMKTTKELGVDLTAGSKKH